jgi:hypothetical protein
MLLPDTGAAVIEGPYRYFLRRVLPGNGNDENRPGQDDS